MSEGITETSTGLKARIAGGLWLIVIAAAGFAFLVASTLIVRNDAAATANNVLEKGALFRLSILADLVADLSYIGVTVFLYELLKPVNRSLSLLAAFFGLGGVSLLGAGFLSRLGPLVLLRGDQLLSVFTTSQLQAVTLTSLELYFLGLNISMVLFGLQCIIVGCLFFRSTFFPRIPGLLLAIGGSSYVVHSFASVLSPSFGSTLSYFILPTALMGEGSVSLWLLMMGVNLPRWRERASSTPSPST